MNSELLMSYFLLYILNIITYKKKESISKVSILFFITPSGEFLLDESTRQKPTSAFPEHSVEAVWEAEMPSKAEPLRTACVPGIPKCLPSPIPCYLPWYEMFNGQVVCLLVNSWKECMLNSDSVPVSEDMERKGWLSTWISLQNVQMKYSELFPSSLRLCLPPHSGLQTPQVKWLCYSHLLSGSILATGHLLRVSIRQRREVDMKI